MAVGWLSADVERSVKTPIPKELVTSAALELRGKFADDRLHALINTLSSAALTLPR